MNSFFTTMVYATSAHRKPSISGTGRPAPSATLPLRRRHHGEVAVGESRPPSRKAARSRRSEPLVRLGVQQRQLRGERAGEGALEPAENVGADALPPRARGRRSRTAPTPRAVAAIWSLPSAFDVPVRLDRDDGHVRRPTAAPRCCTGSRRKPSPAARAPAAGIGWSVSSLLPSVDAGRRCHAVSRPAAVQRTGYRIAEHGDQPPPRAVGPLSLTALRAWYAAGGGTMLAKRSSSSSTPKTAAAPRRKKRAAPVHGLTAADVAGGPQPVEVEALCQAIRESGGGVVGAYRDPVGGHWQVVASLPIDRVGPTPFQRDISEPHVARLADVIGRMERYLDPIVAVRGPEGEFWTPNGHHRLAAMRGLGARSILAVVVPEASVAYQILAMNTEKGHNLREKSLEVVRMARSLAELEPRTETGVRPGVRGGIAAHPRPRVREARPAERRRLPPGAEAGRNVPRRAPGGRAPGSGRDGRTGCSRSTTG